MIFGDCPYCNEPQANHLSDNHIGCVESVECKKCENTYYLLHSRLHSRIDPKVYKEDQIVRDEKTKMILGFK